MGEVHSEVSLKTEGKLPEGDISLEWMIILNIS
jgi:hypothetical protein